MRKPARRVASAPSAFTPRSPNMTRILEVEMSIKKLALLSASALIVGAMLAVPATAHHSFAPYDAQNPITIEGNLKEINFANPHVGVVVVAMKDGKEITYRDRKSVV